MFARLMRNPWVKMNCLSMGRVWKNISEIQSHKCNNSEAILLFCRYNGMKKILIIEDDPVFGLVYEKFLTTHGFSVRVARDGAAGLEQLNTFRPDAVLLDLMMPKLNGF